MKRVALTAVLVALIATASVSAGTDRATVKGVIVDTAGVPYKYAFIEFSPAGGESVFDLTDKHGKFRVKLSRGVTYTVTVHGWDNTPRELMVDQRSARVVIVVT